MLHYKPLVLLLIAFSILSLTAQAQPMVVYSVGADLFIGTGEAGSFVGANQGNASIPDLAIDPATRKIYYFNTINGSIGIANSDGTSAGTLALAAPLITPKSIRVSQGILY